MNFLQNCQARAQSCYNTGAEKLTALNAYLTANNADTKKHQTLVDVYTVAMPVFVVLATAIAISAAAFLVKPLAGAAMGTYLFLNKEKLATLNNYSKAALVVIAVVVTFFQPLFAFSMIAGTASSYAATKLTERMPKNLEDLKTQFGDTPGAFVNNLVEKLGM